MSKSVFSELTRDAIKLAATQGISVNAKARALKSDADPQKTLSNAISALQDVKRTTRPPIRTLHHFSCSGGTMLAKCIASMANVMMLNEVDPLSEIPFRGDLDRFSPTDLVALLYQSGTPPEPKLIAEMFCSSIAQVSAHLAQHGKTLVLRDHTHGHFLYGEGRGNEFALKNILDRAELPSLSLVTVRHPARSYQSMVKAGWDSHLEPNTFDEYCRRYLAFLDIYEGTEIIRYEDFVSAPDEGMQKICEILQLDYFAEFQDVFDSFKFSGDSGRSSGTIEPRAPTPIADEILQQLSSGAYRELVDRLDYEDLPVGDKET